MPNRSATMMSGASGDTVGGLHGVIPTRDIPAARRAYLEYVEGFKGPDQDRLDFGEFAREWKKRKQD